MPERKIYCSGCQLFLGTIHKAKLRKNMVFLCETCEMNRYLDKGKANKTETKTDNPFGDIFGGAFKGKM